MSPPPVPSAAPAAPSPPSAWSPFRHRLFAAMWGAQFVSNIGSWMQTVAAQWLMLSLTTSATYVALVQTAAGLPVVLFAVLAGTIGDLVDRRRFLLITQSVMLIAAAWSQPETPPIRIRSGITRSQARDRIASYMARGP